MRRFKPRELGELGKGSVQRLLVLLGDQLDHNSAALRSLDPKADAVLMMEVKAEATHVPSHRQRTTLFLSAMRHFALDLHQRRWRVRYITLDDKSNTHSFDGEIRRAVKDLAPEQLHFIEPGEWRVQKIVDALADELPVDVQVHEDDHFLCTKKQFAEWADGRKQLIMEHFYRKMRRDHKALVDDAGEPEGGQWNYDSENRKTWKDSAEKLPKPRMFRPNEITKEVIELVENTFPDAPGSLDSFRWPVSRTEALAALNDFINTRLRYFGDYQDSMVTDQPWMFHSLISCAINLKLLNPRECVRKAIEAYEKGDAPLNCVEGFIRQIIGWREFIRGVYWWAGPDYRDRNELNAKRDLPWMYWSGETDMNCMKHCLGQVLESGYGHHIQRLMVTGNFALLAGIDPQQISDWYLAMYVDAVDWVTLPNTLGMVMYADGGLVATKPYAAGGNYINRMSDYCKNCRYNPKKSTGDDACPFSTLYWDFIDRNEARFKDNRRMSLTLKNLERKDRKEIKAIRSRAQEVLDSMYQQ